MLTKIDLHNIYNTIIVILEDYFDKTHTPPTLKFKHIDTSYAYYKKKVIVLGMKGFRYYCDKGYTEYPSIQKQILKNKVIRDEKEIATVLMLHELTHYFVYWKDPYADDHRKEFKKIYKKLLKYFKLI
jgi:hypothetical protein